MIHSMFIVIHALAGAVSLGAGILSMSLTSVRSWRFRVYLVSLAVMAVALAAAVGWDWGQLAAGVQITYAALTILAVLLVVLAFRAADRLRTRDHNWRGRYVDAVGFTLISLWNAFTIVAAIDLGAPVWLVVVVAVVSVAVAVWAKNSAKSRILATAPPGPVRRGPNSPGRSLHAGTPATS